MDLVWFSVICTIPLSKFLSENNLHLKQGIIFQTRSFNFYKPYFKYYITKK